MEIHRPKPWHGMRELAKEAGVIVIGIAIAIGGEQAIEWLHRHAQVAEARHALRAEIAANATFAVANIQKERCLLALLEREVAWARGGPRPPNVLPRPFFEMRTSNWQVVKAGAAAHMPLAERLAYSSFYDNAESEHLNIRTEVPLWVRLAGHSARTLLTPADAQNILEDAAALRIIGTVRLGTNASVLAEAKKMGMQPTPFSAAQRENLAATCVL